MGKGRRGRGGEIGKGRRGRGGEMGKGRRGSGEGEERWKSKGEMGKGRRDGKGRREESDGIRLNAFFLYSQNWHQVSTAVRLGLMY